MSTDRNRDKRPHKESPAASESQVLRLLLDDGPQPLERVAASIGAPQWTIAGVADRLAMRGLVIRVPSAAAPDRELIVLSTSGRLIATDLQCNGTPPSRAISGPPRTQATK